MSESPKTFEVRIKGELSDAVVSAIGADRIEESGTRVLFEAADKASIHGFMRRLEDLGLEVVSITPAESSDQEDAREAREPSEGDR